MAKDHDSLFKILLIGDDSSTKEVVASKLTDQSTVDGQLSTLGFSCQQKMIPHEGEIIKLQVWDTAGQERFRFLDSSFFRNVDGVVFAFSIERIASFEFIKSKLCELIDSIRDKSIVTLLWGLHCDPDTEPEVSSDHIQMFAESYRVNYVQSDPGSNSDQITLELVKAIKSKLSTQLPSEH